MKAANRKNTYPGKDACCKKAVFCAFAVEIKNLHHKTSVSRIPVKALIRTVLKEERVRSAQITVVFLSDPSIRRLNKKFLFRDSPTDVLSFDLKYQGHPQDEVIGDIVVSLDAARAASKSLGISFREELYRYCVHGILHLLGYDDTTALEKKKMWKRQEELLKYFKSLS